MPYASSVEQWRVYSAEQSLGELSPITEDQARQIVADAEASEWWQEAFPNAQPIEVTFGGGANHDEGYIQSFAEPRGYPRPHSFVVSIHPEMMFLNTLVHELAHCVMPRVTETLSGYGRANSTAAAIARTGDTSPQRRESLPSGSCRTLERRH